MSNVPPSKRSVSSVEYVYNAAQLYHITLDCVIRLPKRWTFLISERTANTAASVLHHAKSANSIYVTCAVDAQLRRAHIQEAYCATQVLSSYVDEIYDRFPANAENGKPCISQAWYLKWIECIDKEFSLLKGVLRSDAKRYGDYYADTACGIPIGTQLDFFSSG